MRVKGLILEDFKRLRLSRIKKLTMDTDDSDTHLLIGSNGSGKSSLLHELYPYPPVKTTFGERGYKELHLTHGNIEYKLIYTPSDGHLFFRDGVNLNTSGTNEVQRELISEHLGLSGDIHTILKCSLPVCEMTPSIRKKALIALNPVDIDIFGERYKKVHKEVVAHSNNLDMLYKRHKQLVSQKLPDDQYLAMTQQKDILANQEKLLLMWITKVGEAISGYNLTPSDHDPVSLKFKIIGILRTLPKFSDIKRKACTEHLTEYATKIEMIESELLGLDDSLSETTTALDKYEARKRELVEEGGSIVDELRLLRSQLKTFNFESDFVGIPKHQLSECESVIEPIRDIFLGLIDLEYDQLFTRSELNEAHRRMLTYQAESTEYTQALSSVVKRRDELKNTTKSYEIPKSCDAGQCELYSVYDKHRQSKLNEIAELDKKYIELETQLNEAHEKAANSTKIYQVQVQAWTKIDQIISLVASRPALARQFTSDMIVERFLLAPLDFVNDLIRYIGDSVAFIEYQLLLNKHAELEKLNSAIESKKQISADVLNDEIEKYTQKLHQLRTTHSAKNTYRNELTTKLMHLRQFTEVKAHIVELDLIVADHEVYVRQNAELTYLKKLYTIIDNLLIKVRSELTDILSICKSQELLLTRIDKEVDSVVAELKPIYEESKLIENALFNLPILYTRTFINDVIETTNYFINEISTYSMQLSTFTETDVLDFTFPVTVEGILVKDISECSDGQKAIIKLSFNLALIVELKYNDYPIYVDEIDRALDAAHCIRLTNLLNELVAKGVISQMFVINHHQSMMEGIVAAITVLNGENISLPEHYNEHVTFKYF